MPFHIQISPFHSDILPKPPIKCCWFLIQFLTTLSTTQFQQFQIRYNLSLETRYQINSHCYEYCLTSVQKDLLSNNPLVSITPLVKDFNRKIQMKSENSPKCLIRSNSDWSPIDSTIEYKKISFDIYIANVPCSKFLNDKRIKAANNYKSKKILNRYISGFLQSGSEKGVFENGSFVSPHPLFDIGIHGENQLISVTDTGVDLLHNFFYDPKYSKIEINTTYLDHRKLHSYYSISDSLDTKEGHGTHSCGVALGEALDTNSGISLYNGISPKSKLFFFDIGDSKDASPLSGEFDGDKLYQLMSENGVSVCSNSWGIESLYPDSIITAEYDKYAYENPEMLFVFPAGNEGGDKGEIEAKYYCTINSPGDSKNCLSVGSTTSTHLSSIEDERTWAIEIDGEKEVKCEADLNNGPDPWDHFTWSTIKHPHCNLSVIFYDSSIPSVAGAAVFLSNEENFCRDAKEVEEKGAAAIVRLSGDSALKCARSSDSFVEIPVFSVSEPIDRTAKRLSIIPQPSKSGKIRLSAFSSLGPSIRGIVKPDLVAPGEDITSSKAGDPLDASPRPATADTLMKSTGTSVSTSAISGLAALARQFFADGFYPTRKPATQDRFESVPSSLIRAVLVNSAKPLDSPSKIAVSESGPNIRSGFGVPSLSSALLSSAMRVVRNGQIRSNEKHVYPLNIQYRNGTDLRVTLAYLDPPISEDASVPLFADLNLHIVAPSGKLYTGNGHKNNQTEMTNTIERIFVPSEEIEIDSYRLIVTSTKFPQNLIECINYSIVINGPFDHSDFEANKAAPAISTAESCLQASNDINNCRTCDVKCQNNGLCDTKTGRCMCDASHVGFDCAIEITQFSMETKYSLKLNPNEILYVKIPIESYDEKNKPTIHASSSNKESIYGIYVSDQPFYSLSDPNLESILADGYNDVSSPLTLTGTADETANFVVYLAFVTSGPEQIDLEFDLSVQNPQFSSDLPIITVQTTEYTEQPADNNENQSIDENSLVKSLFLFLMFLSVILLILCLVYIFVVIVFKYKIRNAPILTE